MELHKVMNITWRFQTWKCTPEWAPNSIHGKGFSIGWVCLGHNHRIFVSKSNAMRQSLLLYKNLYLSLLLLTEFRDSSAMSIEAILHSMMPLLISSIAFSDRSLGPIRRAQQCFSMRKICLLSLRFARKQLSIVQECFSIWSLIQLTAIGGGECQTLGCCWRERGKWVICTGFPGTKDNMSWRHKERTESSCPSHGFQLVLC